MRVRCEARFRKCFILMGKPSKVYSHCTFLKKRTLIEMEIRNALTIRPFLKHMYWLPASVTDSEIQLQPEQEREEVLVIYSITTIFLTLNFIFVHLLN